MRAAVDGRSTGVVEIVVRVGNPVVTVASGRIGLQARRDIHGGARHAERQKDLLTHKIGVSSPGEP